MPAQDGTAQRIVVGVDGSPSAAASLRWAVQQAARTGASVDAVLAWEHPTVAAGFGLGPVAMIDVD